MNPARLIIGAGALALALAACATREDSALLDSAGVAGPEQPPVIVIPGLLASRLVDPETGRRVWPPNLAMLIGGWRMHDLAIPVPYEASARSARLRPTDVVLSRPRRDYYSSLLETLEAVGYECSTPLEITAATSCVLFSWDWRRGFVAAAADLDALVERLREQRGQSDLSVDVVGHSAGALIARYYAHYGAADVIDGEGETDTRSGRVRRLALVGPPNRGSVYAAQRLMRGYPLGLLAVNPEVLATFESAYELLPEPGREWLIDLEGRTVERDLYDIDSWREFGVSIFDPEIRQRVAERAGSTSDARRRLRTLEQRFAAGLERGRRFHAAIDEAGPGSTERLVLGSDCERTPHMMVVERLASRDVLRFSPDEIAEPIPGVDYAALMFEPGDGRVTRASMLAIKDAGPRTKAAPGGTTEFEVVCERHSEMTSNQRVQRALLDFLLDRDGSAR